MGEIKYYEVNLVIMNIENNREKITKSQTQLIESIVAEVEKEKVESKKHFDVEDTVRWINQGGNLTWEQASSIKKLGHYQALNYITKTLQEVLGKIK